MVMVPKSKQKECSQLFVFTPFNCLQNCWMQCV